MHCKVLILFLLLATLNSSCQSNKLKYPKINFQTSTEDIHGIKLIDSYRNLEESNDPLVANWYENQSIFTDSILNTYESIDEIEAKIDTLNMATTSWAYSIKSDDFENLYYLKYREDDPNYILFYKNKISGKETVLYDPSEYKKKEGNEFYIDYFQPSWDGKFVAISLRFTSQLTSEIRILETSTKKLKDDLILNSRPVSFGGINWLPDSSGFTYLFFPVVEKGKKGYMTNSVTRLHLLNEVNIEDSDIFGSKQVDIGSNLFPFVKISSSNSNYVIGHLMENPHYYDTYYTSVESIKINQPEWKKLYTKEDLVYINAGKEKDNKYYFISGKEETNFSLNYVELGSVNMDSPIIIQDGMIDEVIKDFTLVDNGLYFTTTKNGIETSLYYYHANKTQKVELPFVAGNLELIPNNNKGSKILIELSGWANDLTRFSVSNGIIESSLILADTPFVAEYEDLESEEIIAIGHDGTEIPVSIIYSKKLGKTNRPALIRSYGAYGHNIDPHYDRMLLSWITLGGIHVIPHIRGGGEKGKDWHDAGKKNTKSNSWKDIISSTEYIISKGYTTKDKTILFSESAGTISQGMAVIERPDLYKVFLARVPLLNPTRLKSGSHEQTSYTEFGDIDKSDEIESLIAMDPYYNLNKNISFPATLLLAAQDDDRLDIWETGKFIAKLQNDIKTTSPKLLKIMPNWGHEDVSARGYALLFGFALEHIEK